LVIHEILEFIHLVLVVGLGHVIYAFCEDLSDY